VAHFKKLAASVHPVKVCKNRSGIVFVVAFGNGESVKFDFAAHDFFRGFLGIHFSGKFEFAGFERFAEIFLLDHPHEPLCICDDLGFGKFFRGAVPCITFFDDDCRFVWNFDFRCFESLISAVERITFEKRDRSRYYKNRQNYFFHAYPFFGFLKLCL
jgi:hypothetical protein